MTAEKRRTVVRVILALVILALIAGVSWMYWVFKHPLETHARKMRRALAEEGLEKVETELAGHRLVYWWGGEGPLLVLLHGAGHQAGSWAPVVGPLLVGHSLLIPDLPGHGESEPREGTLPFDVVYSGLEALLKSLEVEPPPVLIGNSMGAWLATVYAHRNPDSVVRVVAVNGGPVMGNPDNPSLVPPDREAARELMALLRDPSSPEIPDFVLDDIVRRAAAGPIGRLLQAPESFGEFFLDGRLSEVTVPVELVWGVSDRFMGLDYAERMVTGLSRARLTEVPTCGHIPQNECPARFAEILIEVLSSKPPPEAVPIDVPAAEGGSSQPEAANDPS